MRVTVVPKAIPAWLVVVEDAAVLLKSLVCSTIAQIKASLFCISVFAVELRLILLVPVAVHESYSLLYAVLKSIEEKKSEVAIFELPSPPKAVLFKTITSAESFVLPTILSEVFDIVPVKPLVSK